MAEGEAAVKEEPATAREDSTSGSDGVQKDQPSDSPESEEKLSKRQLKKLKRQEYWNSVRQERRKEERKRRQKRKADGEARGESSRKRVKKTTEGDMESSCSVTVALDMSFDEFMSEKDRKKALTQIQYCYSANRRSDRPIKLYVTSFCGKSRRLFDQVRGCANWDANRIQLKTEDYLDIFPDKERVVYLSSESPNVLDTLEKDKVYVIGGLVDHNAHKGLCHRMADEKGVSHARLPIDEYVVMKTRKVLTINHVFEIMLKFKDSGNWEKAFFDVLPKRKAVEKKDE